MGREAARLSRARGSAGRTCELHTVWRRSRGDRGGGAEGGASCQFFGSIHQRSSSTNCSLQDSCTQFVSIFFPRPNPKKVTPWSPDSPALAAPPRTAPPPLPYPGAASPPSLASPPRPWSSIHPPLPPWPPASGSLHSSPEAPTPFCHHRPPAGSTPTEALG
jgi:hypothetical protein